MKVLRNVVILTFIIIGLLFARAGRDVQKKVNDKNLKIKDKHSWVKYYADEDKVQLDRKRSNKRRRKIRKPVKGLR